MWGKNPTRKKKYKDYVISLWPSKKNNFLFNICFVWQKYFPYNYILKFQAHAMTIRPEK